jgi:hypothetical protein
LVHVYKKPAIDEEVVKVLIDRDEEVVQGVGPAVPQGVAG